ncbi:MAG TPA: hypothetical protein VMQ40_00245 [Acidimicrobiales bacterium]|nr:hypothetical protein [Acidimicrobiales bacterium]
MTTHRQLEFADEQAGAIEAIASIANGKGWCNLTPEIDSTDIEVLSVSVFSLRTKRGSPVATLVTSPPRKGIPRAGTLGVLHTRGRLGAARIESMLNGVAFPIRQDHTQRGLLLEVPGEVDPATVLTVMTSVLADLCDYRRTGNWRLDVFERATT